MKFSTVLIYVFVIICACSGVRINLQGSVSVGKDVWKTLTQYVRAGRMRVHNTRRSGTADDSANSASEQIKWTIKTEKLHENLKFCQGPIGEFIIDYITLLAIAIENVLGGILANDMEAKHDGAIFMDQLKHTLVDVRQVFKDAEELIEHNKDFYWFNLFKQLGAKFQEAAKQFVDERLDGDPQDIKIVKKKLNQKLIVGVILVENEFLTTLCRQFNICEENHECTTALHHVLGDFQSAPNTKAMEFVKYFYENLPDGELTFLNPETLHEFQFILSDLSYSNNSFAKNVFMSVFNAVDARLKHVNSIDTLPKAYDQQLVNVILSDLDAIYYKKRSNFPFDNFIGKFVAWNKQGGKLSQPMRTVMTEIREKLSSYQPSILTRKLANEVKVFLELTIDSE